MEDFKKRFYAFLKNEIDRYEQRESSREPFLYTYLKKKKEAEPRLTILRHYLEYIQNDCRDPQAVIGTAAALLGEKRCGNVPIPADPKACSPQQCRTLVDQVLSAFPYNEKRNDRYVQLREKDLLFRCEKHPDKWRYYLYLLDFTLSCSLPVSGEIFSMFDSVRKNVRPDDAAFPSAETASGENKRKLFRKRLEELRETVDVTDPGTVRSDAVPMRTLHDLTNCLLQVLTKTDAAAWMYDAGYPLKERKESGQISSRQRKADHTMELLDDFFRERGEAFDNRSYTEFSLTGSRKDITGLFELLDKDITRKKAVIPLAIDSATGTGLYIVGTGLFKNSSTSGEFKEYCRKHSCCYNVIFPTELHDCGVRGILQQIDDNPREQIYENNRLDEAYNYYSAIIDLAANDGFAYLFFQDMNAEPPDGCPEAYLKYFLCSYDYAPVEWHEEPKIIPGKRNAGSARKI